MEANECECEEENNDGEESGGVVEGAQIEECQEEMEIEECEVEMSNVPVSDDDDALGIFPVQVNAEKRKAEWSALSQGSRDVCSKLIPSATPSATPHFSSNLSTGAPKHHQA